ncbi:hypothetical protein WJX72_009291 [[Myrmecia] bisecta]|uniref:GDP-D-glucose phosphorylase 1 n=1 Tax=[Myrmecia] bisecta TaxID=41462 RepID=A0AAW1PPH9_9CHLO
MAPMYVSRVPSVYSLQQLEEDSLFPRKGVLSAPEKPVSELAGSLLPKLSFAARTGYKSKRVRSFGDLQRVPDIDDYSWPSVSSDEESSEGTVPSLAAQPAEAGISLLDMVLLAEWEDRAEQDLFRYDVTACPTKLVPGPYGFVAQFNEGRGSKKRPTEFRIDQVCQPFDDKKFNFTKALQKEVLFQFEEGLSSGKQAYAASALVPASPNLVFINVSPIEYGHVLLVPRVLDKISQVVDPRTLLLALEFCHEADNPYFRLCYNSLGAYATVNHLHFQAYYLSAPFAVERAPTAEVMMGLKRRRGEVRISQLAEYPVRGLVFEAGSSLAEMADVVGEACQRLQKANIPHNLFVVDCGQRVFLFPNAFAEAKANNLVPEDLLDSQVDPAGFEISGHLILKRQQDYDNITQDWVWRLLSYASLSAEGFADFAKLALDC